MKPTIETDRYSLFTGDCLEVLRSLPSESVHCCVTSPPFWGLRDYGAEGQYGLESTPAEYVAKMVAVFREVRRVLRDDGTLWLNLGDSYGRGERVNNPSDRLRGQTGNTGQTGVVISDGYGAGAVMANKQLVGIPWRVAFALQADGWYLRQDIIWHKPNPMPESVTDRCTKAHEYIFLLSKNERYYFDAEAIKEKAAYAGEMRGGSTNRYEQNESGMDCKVYNTRNKRSVWTVNTAPFKGAHFATYPPKLIEPCILAGCPVDGVVLEPFLGSGTTIATALKHGRRGIGIELNPAYMSIAEKRIAGEANHLFANTEQA
jgi:site-specific DNA-methyltransferase (adenine-specific)